MYTNTNVNKRKVYKHQHLKCNCSGRNIFFPEGRQVALFMNTAVVREGSCQSFRISQMSRETKSLGAVIRFLW